MASWSSCGSWPSRRQPERAAVLLQQAGSAGISRQPSRGCTCSASTRSRRTDRGCASAHRRAAASKPAARHKPADPSLRPGAAPAGARGVRPPAPAQSRPAPPAGVSFCQRSPCGAKPQARMKLSTSPRSRGAGRRSTAASGQPAAADAAHPAPGKDRRRGGVTSRTSRSCSSARSSCSAIFTAPSSRSLKRAANSTCRRSASFATVPAAGAAKFYRGR